MTAQKKNNPRPGRWPFPVLAAIIAGFLALTLSASRQNSITFDEPAHLAAGVSYLRTGNFRLEAFNSPLVRVLAALPVFRDRQVSIPTGEAWDNPDFPDIFDYAFVFMYLNKTTLRSAVQEGRAVISLLGALAVALAFLVSRRYWGPAAAVVAAVVLAFDPTFMAHSGLVTSDAAAAFAYTGGVAAVFLFARRPGAVRAIAAGAVLGLGAVTKYSCVLPAILAPALILLARKPGRAKPARWIFLTAAVYLSAWLTICAFFGFQGVGYPLSSIEFESRAFRRLAVSLPPRLPAPLPAPLLRGIDTMSLSNEKANPNYFMGKIYMDNNPLYIPAAFALKTPLPSICLLLLGAFGFIRSKAFSRGFKLFILLPVLAHVLLVVFFSNWNIGLRYLLPAYPLAAVIAGSAASDKVFRSRAVRGLALFLAGGTIAANLAAFPQHLSYFNLLSGGPDQAHRLLADSNLDWGQDLIRLKQYTEREKTGQICLAYFGTVDPEIYGIDYVTPEEAKQCATLAVSVQLLIGLSYFSPAHGELVAYPYGTFTYLLARPPHARAGHSIWIFLNPDPKE